MYQESLRKNPTTTYQSFSKNFDLFASNFFDKSMTKKEEYEKKRSSHQSSVLEFSDIQNMKGRLDQLMKSTQFIIQKQNINVDCFHESTKLNNIDSSEKLLYSRQIDLEQLSSQQELEYNVNKLEPSFCFERNLSKKKFYNQVDANDFSFLPFQKSEKSTHFDSLENKDFPESFKKIVIEPPIKRNPQKLESLLIEPKSLKKLKKKINTTHELLTAREYETEKKRPVSNEEPVVSWTKYISLEMKCEKLQNDLKISQNEKQQESERYQKVIQQKQTLIQQLNKQLYQQTNEIKEKYELRQKQYEEKISEKSEHIRELVEQLSRLAINKKNSQNLNLDQIIQSNHDLQLEVEEKQRNLFEIDFDFKALQERSKQSEKQQNFLKEEVKRLMNEIQILVQTEDRNQKLEQIIKVHLEGAEQNFQQIELLKQENNQSHEKAQKMKREYEKLVNEHNLIKVKQSSTRNRVATEMGIKLQEKDNLIKRQERKINVLEEKYKAAGKEIKEKDEFFRQYLLGRCEDTDMQSHICEILKKYEEKFQDRSQIEKVKEENKVLEEKLRLYTRNWIN